VTLALLFLENGPVLEIFLRHQILISELIPLLLAFMNITIGLHECVWMLVSLVQANFVLLSQAMRLFVGSPIWTPYNRPQDDHPIR
jgi:hypothetical protein